MFFCQQIILKQFVLISVIRGELHLIHFISVTNQHNTIIYRITINNYRFSLFIQTDSFSLHIDKR